MAKFPLTSLEWASAALNGYYTGAATRKTIIETIGKKISNLIETRPLTYRARKKKTGLYPRTKDRPRWSTVYRSFAGSSGEVILDDQFDWRRRIILVRGYFRNATNFDDCLPHNLDDKFLGHLEQTLPIPGGSELFVDYAESNFHTTFFSGDGMNPGPKELDCYYYDEPYPFIRLQAEDSAIYHYYHVSGSPVVGRPVDSYEPHPFVWVNKSTGDLMAKVSQYKLVGSANTAAPESYPPETLAESTPRALHDVSSIRFNLAATFFASHQYVKAED